MALFEQSTRLKAERKGRTLVQQQDIRLAAPAECERFIRPNRVNLTDSTELLGIRQSLLCMELIMLYVLARPESAGQVARKR